MGKFQTQKLMRPIVLKDAYIYLLETTFVLRLFKVLSAPSRVSVSNIEIMAKKFKNLQFFLDFFKSFYPNRTHYSLFDASCKSLQGKKTQ
jgi:hypothetical protein